MPLNEPPTAGVPPVTGTLTTSPNPLAPPTAVTPYRLEPASKKCSPTPSPAAASQFLAAVTETIGPADSCKSGSIQRATFLRRSAISPNPTAPRPSMARDEGSGLGRLKAKTVPSPLVPPWLVVP